MAFLTQTRTCKETDCDRTHHARDLCRKHYLRFMKNGTTADLLHHSSGTSEHKTWCAMRNRVNNPNDRNYCHYGGRGIKICDRWSDFENFLEDMGKRPSLKHSIDRIDNNGNYTPENCRWVTQKEQNHNKRYRSGYRGVYASGKKWIAKIQIQGKENYLGTFESKDEAATVWNSIASQYRELENHKNIIGVGYGVL